MAKKTVGQKSIELQNESNNNETESQITPTEQMREQLNDYDSNITDCISATVKKFGKDTDFFIVVITKKEPLMPNVIRNYFFARRSCPTPDYDQIIYKYNSKVGDFELIWVIPSRDTCFLFKRNALHVRHEEKKLLKFILDFSDGTLFKLAKKLNGEKLKTLELENGRKDGRKRF